MEQVVKILMADDDGDVWANSIKMFMRDMPHVDLSCVQNPDACRDRISDESYAIILLDISFSKDAAEGISEAMDEVRNEEWRKVEKINKVALKGLRWVLFRNSSTRHKGQTRTINKLKRSNNRIYRAWLLKDEFALFWDYNYVGLAKNFLKHLTRRALLSRLEPMRKFVDTLREHQSHILSFLETGITNAKGEGINRVLQMVKQRASGFLNLDGFSDLIYLVTGDLDIPAQIPVRFQTV
jgi:hypothetical protein